MKFTLDGGSPLLFAECNGLFVIEAWIQLCAVQKLFGLCCGGCTVKICLLCRELGFEGSHCLAAVVCRAAWLTLGVDRLCRTVPSAG
jgi:hypothetical protein